MRSRLVAAFLLLIPLTTLAATRTWTGAGGNALWSNAANWDSGPPANGDDVVFPDLGAPLSTTNDLSGLALNSIQTSAADLTLRGNAIVLGAGGINASNLIAYSKLTIDLPITLGASQSWRTFGYSTVNLNGDVDLGSGDLSISASLYGVATVYLHGTMSGGGTLQVSTGYWGSLIVDGHINTRSAVKLFCTSVVLLNTNSFPGPLTMIPHDTYFSGGSLWIESPDALSPGMVLDLTAITVRIKSVPLEIAAWRGSGAGGRHLPVYVLDFDDGSLTLRGPGSSSLYGEVTGPGAWTVAGGSHSVRCLYASTFSGPLAVTGGSLGIEDCTLRTDATVSHGALKVVNSTLQSTTVTGGTLEMAGGELWHYLWGTEVKPGVFLGHLTMDSSSTLIEPVKAGSYWPQYLFADGASLGNAKLELLPIDNMPLTFIILKNSGTAPIDGTFAGLPEGAVFTVGGTDYRIDYHGGDGNDITAAEIHWTQTILTTSPSPSGQHRPVTLTATVIAPTGGPRLTGIVKFFDGATELGFASVDAPTLTVRFLEGGYHILTAVYLGDGMYHPSTSDQFYQLVRELPKTTTSLTALPNPAPAGGNVTLDVQVTTGVRTISGDVTIFDGATPIATRTLDESGHVTITTSAVTMSAAPHPLTARYAGTDDLLDSVSEPVMLTVTRVPSQVSLISSPNPANEGNFVTITAAVAPQFGGGTVTFFNGPTRLGSVAVDARGTAALRTTFTRGTHELSARFSGNELLLPSTSAALPQTVVVPAAPTSIELAVVPNPAWALQPVTLTATVHHAAGTVDFLDGTMPLGSATLDASGKATVTTALTAGLHVLGAVYRGSLEFESSSTSAVVAVNERPPTQTTLTSSPNPSQHQQPVELFAVVRGIGGVPHGTVMFSADGADLGNAPLDDLGRAFLTTSALNDGLHLLTASYSGDFASSAGSTSHDVRSGPATCQWPLLAPIDDITVPWQGTATIAASMRGDPPLQCEWYRGRYPDSTEEIEGTWLDAATSTVKLDRLTSSTELWVVAKNACGSAHTAVKITVLPKTRRPAVPH